MTTSWTHLHIPTDLIITYWHFIKVFPTHQWSFKLHHLALNVFIFDKHVLIVQKCLCCWSIKDKVLYVQILHTILLCLQHLSGCGAEEAQQCLLRAIYNTDSPGAMLLGAPISQHIAHATGMDKVQSLGIWKKWGVI